MTTWVLISNSPFSPTLFVSCSYHIHLLFFVLCRLYGWVCVHCPVYSARQTGSISCHLHLNTVILVYAYQDTVTSFRQDFSSFSYFTSRPIAAHSASAEPDEHDYLVVYFHPTRLMPVRKSIAPTYTSFLL